MKSLKTKASANRVGSKDAPVKTINAGMLANTDSLHLRVKVLKGDKEIYNERANSLTAGFVGLLNYWLGPMDASDTGHPESSNTYYQPKPNSHIFANGRLHTNSTPPTHPILADISSWPASDTIRITHNSSAQVNRQWRDAHYIVIQNPDNAGIYKVLGVDIINTTTTDIQLEGLNADAGDSVEGGCIGISAFNTRRFTTPFTTSGRANRIYIGRSSEPTSIYDFWLHDMHDLDDFTGYNINVTPPVIAVNQSRIAMSAQFTNVSGGQRNVSEIGLTTMLYGHSATGTDTDPNQGQGWLDRNFEPVSGFHSHILMIARDTVTPFTVDPAESFTVIYEIVSSVNVGETSGVVAAFNEILYRQLAVLNRVVRTYFNVDHEDNNSTYPYQIKNTGLENRTLEKILGPILGSEETEVDIDDYFLRNISNGHSRIIHGEENGRLYYYDPVVKDVIKDQNECYFVVERFVENRGSVNVTAKQIGFVCLSAESSSHPALLTHDIIPAVDQITFEPGDIYRIVYKIGVAQN